MLATAMTATLFAGCGGDDKTEDSGSTTPAAPAAPAGTEQDAGADAGADADAGAADAGSQTASGGSVYYLNFKPEQNDAW